MDKVVVHPNVLFRKLRWREMELPIMVDFTELSDFIKRETGPDRRFTVCGWEYDWNDDDVWASFDLESVTVDEEGNIIDNGNEIPIATLTWSTLAKHGFEGEDPCNEGIITEQLAVILATKLACDIRTERGWQGTSYLQPFSFPPPAL